MKRHIVFVAIDKLINHEQVNRVRVDAMRKSLADQRLLRRPVIVDKESRVILDGHHRVMALRKMGAKRVPVVYVRYSDETVRVYLRRKKLLMRLIKRAVIDMARSHRLFQSKTTRHLIVDRPKMRPVRVQDLMR